jgi:hypothetical protein
MQGLSICTYKKSNVGVGNLNAYYKIQLLKHFGKISKNNSMLKCANYFVSAFIAIKKLPLN